MKSTRDFISDHNQKLQITPLYQKGKKKYSEFKNKVSISLLYSVPTHHLENKLKNDIKLTRSLINDFNQKATNSTSSQASCHRSLTLSQGDYCYFNENLKAVYPKTRKLSLGDDLRMTTYAQKILNNRY